MLNQSMENPETCLPGSILLLSDNVFSDNLLIPSADNIVEVQAVDSYNNSCSSPYHPSLTSNASIQWLPGDDENDVLFNDCDNDENDDVFIDQDSAWGSVKCSDEDINNNNSVVVNNNNNNNNNNKNNNSSNFRTDSSSSGSNLNDVNENSNINLNSFHNSSSSNNNSGASKVLLHAAYLEACQSKSLTPLLKHELKYLIQARRVSQGKEEMEVLFENPVNPQLSEAEKERVVRRRSQNREAARRFRQKRKMSEESLIQTIRKLQKDNQSLQSAVQQLRKDKQLLMETVAEHLLICPYMAQMPLEALPDSSSVP